MKLYNISHQPVVLNWSEPAIMPGEAHEFTDEEVAAGVAGDWSEKDPRVGREAEQAFKRRRDGVVITPDNNTNPADAGSEEK